MKKLIVSLVVAVFLAVPMAAQAACTITGEVIRLYETATYSYVYVRTSPLVTDVFYFALQNAELREAVRTGYTTGQDVYLVGSATTCPTTGTLRYGGLVSAVIVNP